MNLPIFEFFIMGFAVFRMTHLIVFDKITEFIRNPFFEEITESTEEGEETIYLIPKKGGLKGFIGELLSCYWCTGVWVTLALYVGKLIYPEVFHPLITILAVAGLAAMLEVAAQKFRVD